MKSKEIMKNVVKMGNSNKKRDWQDDEDNKKSKRQDKKWRDARKKKRDSKRNYNDE